MAECVSIVCYPNDVQTKLSGILKKYKEKYVYREHSIVPFRVLSEKKEVSHYTSYIAYESKVIVTVIFDEMP